jgi:hypothetical protein
MSRSILIGLAAASSLFAGAAMAGDDNGARGSQDLPSAQTTATPAEDALSTDTTARSSTASVPAERLAPTPSANVASSTTITDSTGAIVTRELVTNGPVPDTPENRARYGQPLSHAGRLTAPRGN